MTTRLPTSQEIAALVAFLPRLYAEGFTPITRWHGGPGAEGGATTFPYPEYDETVLAFIRAASADCWCDYDYEPQEAGRMLADADRVGAADLAEIKTMLTYVVRGERFCDGHWGAMIEGGHVRRLLERLTECFHVNQDLKQEGGR
jgi:hypothetical protein